MTSGPPEAVLTPALIHTVYGVHAEVAAHPATGRLHVVLLPANLGELRALRELSVEGKISCVN